MTLLPSKIIKKIQILPVPIRSLTIYLLLPGQTIYIILYMNKIFILSTLASSLFMVSKGQNKHIIVGDAVPVFSLHDQNDSLFNISDFIGKKILVIYFYPKDESSGCTKEACSFRDNYNMFTKAGAMVIGINSGTVDSHKKFIQNHLLPFTLLSDPGNKVLKMFGVKSKFFITGRETFVIDLLGKVIFTYDSFTNGSAHEKETLQFIEKMQKN
jgi:thioredoxin-dependent peroxiredoxin